MFEPRESLVSILIVDGDRRVRRGLSGILEATDRVDVIGCVSTVVEAVDLAHQHCPDAVLIDIDRPDAADWLGLLPAFRRACPCAAVVVLSGAETLREDALRAGADAYLDRYEAAETLAEAVVALVGDPPGRANPNSDHPWRRTR